MAPRGKKNKTATGSSTPNPEDSVKAATSDGGAINNPLSLAPVESAPITTSTTASAPAPTPPADKLDADGEPKASKNPYVREIQKRVAKINKKKRQIEQIEAKIQHLPAEEQHTTTLINKDERAKLSAKTALATQLTEYNDILHSFVTVTSDDEKRITDEKTTSDAHIANQLDQARKEGKEEGIASQKDVLHTLFNFLRLAGYRRQIPDGEPLENDAIEKVLIMVYSSQDTATNAAELMSTGSEEKVEGTDVSYARIKELSNTLAIDGEGVAQEGAEVEPEGGSLDTSTVLVSEGQAPIEDAQETAPAQTLTTSLTNGDSAVPSAGMVDDGAANTAALQHTTQESPATAPLDAWEKVPSGGESHENGGAVPGTSAEAPGDKGQSWAEESNDAAQQATSGEPNSEEAFREVSHKHGSQRGRRGDGYRGDGYRGDGHRGRGGFRGDGHRGEGYRGRGGGYRGRGDFRGRGGEFRGRGDRGDRNGSGFRGRGTWNEHRGDRQENRGESQPAES